MKAPSKFLDTSEYFSEFYLVIFVSTLLYLPEELYLASRATREIQKQQYENNKRVRCLEESRIQS
jgi:energy-converting hydrogenase Eha subunit H